MLPASVPCRQDLLHRILGSSQIYPRRWKVTRHAYQPGKITVVGKYAASCNIVFRVGKLDRHKALSRINAAKAYKHYGDQIGSPGCILSRLVLMLLSASCRTSGREPPTAPKSRVIITPLSML